MKIIVLGAGMVGTAMALDLAKRHDVTSTDIDTTALEKVKSKNKSISIVRLDVASETDLSKAISVFDLVISAVPGFLGFRTLRTIIQSGKNVVDISFFPEDGLELDGLAKENGVTAIIDCGVAPGMDNLILGYHDKHMKIQSFECLVGGLPLAKKWPFAYKAPFSPIDVIEEYTRPARYVENFQLITRPALTDCEYLEFENIGTLESFNSDGLRSIIHTMKHIPFMKEKTLRYPGHVEYIRVLKESGFFDTKSIEVNGVQISPLQFTSKILFNEWKLGATEKELTIMRITIEGTNDDGSLETIIYHLHDQYNEQTGISSMSRTTGYTATASANMLIEGLFDQKGVFPPELIGSNESCFNFIMSYLNDRGVVYRKEVIMS